MNEQDAIRDFFERIERTYIPYLVGGSMASSAHGNPRQTNDIDIALQLDESAVSAFLKEFGEDFMVSRSTIMQALEDGDQYRSFQMTHFDSLLRIDCFIPIGTEFQVSEFARRQRLEILPGVTVYVSSPEDIVLRKLDWFRMGGEVSDRQWNDIVSVLDVQKAVLDYDYLETWARQLGLHELLIRARSQVVD